MWRIALLTATLALTASCAFCAAPLECVDDVNCPATTPVCTRGICALSAPRDDAGATVVDDAGVVADAGVDDGGVDDAGVDDAGVVVDGGVVDDAGVGVDGGVDAGEVEPTDGGVDHASCDSVFASTDPALLGAGDVVVTLDPDRDGGVAPFAALCHPAFGHHWALVLRDDPNSDLNFTSDAFWESATPDGGLVNASDFTTAGIDAHYLAFWRVPVVEILGALGDDEVTFPLPAAVQSGSLAETFALIGGIGAGESGIGVDAGHVESWLQLAPQLETGCRESVVGEFDSGGLARVRIGIQGDDDACLIDAGPSNIESANSYVGVGGDCVAIGALGEDLPTSGACLNLDDGNTTPTPISGALYVR